MTHKLERVVRPPAMCLQELKDVLIERYPELAEDPHFRKRAIFDCLEVYGQSCAIRNGFLRLGMAAASFDCRILALGLAVGSKRRMKNQITFGVREKG